MRFILITLLFFIWGSDINASPESNNKYFNLADKALLYHQYEKAISNYLKGLNYADHKEIPKVWDDLGYAYLQIKKIKKAQSYLKRALSAYPENFNIHLYLAIAHILNDEMNLASSEIEKIEKNIYFDNSWIKRISDYKLRRVDGEIVTKEDVRRLRKEKGIYIEKITERDALVPLAIIHIDAFDEKNEAAFYFSQGIVHEMAGNFKRAEEQLLAAMEAGYEEKEVRYQLASVYYKMDRSAEAEKLLDKLKKFLKEINKDKTEKSIVFRSPHEIEFRIHHRLRNNSNDMLPILHDHFLEELEKGKLDESIKILERALDIDEWSFEINHNIALLYFDTGELEKAEKFCARALWLKREHPGCHDLMGNIYFHQEAYEKALNEFKRILEIDEWNAYAYYNLGSVYSVLDDWSEAEYNWKKAIECDKKKLKIGDEKNFTEKGLEYSLLVKIKSITYLSHRALGNLYSRKGMIDKAIDELEKALEIKPRGAEPYLDLAVLYHKKKENAMVTAYLRRYLYLGGKREKEARKLLDQIKKEIH